MNEASRKLFFALWPDAVTQIALDAVASTLHAAWGGRKVNQAGLHLTLAYLGDTSAIRLNPLRQLSGSITGQPFSLILKRPGCWPHNRVGGYGPADTPPALTQLVADFRRVLRAGEFPVDNQPYVPHVTLLRNARCGMPPHCPSVNWHASSLFYWRRVHVAWVAMNCWMSGRCHIVNAGRTLQ